MTLHRSRYGLIILAIFSAQFFGIEGAVSPSPALAATPEICGNGIDDDGVGGDLPCPEPDKDNDGALSSGSASLDCDDNDSKIYPGVVTAKGCAPGETHTCLSTGAYSSCTASPVCEATGTGTCKYIDCGAGSDSAGNGSYGNPWKSLRMVGSYIGNTPPSGWYHVQPGDVIYIKGSGTCSEVYTPGPGYQPVMLYWNSTSTGNTGNLLTLKRYPGATAVFDPPFVKANRGYVIQTEDSSFLKIDDLELTDSYGAVIYTTGTHDVEISRVKCHDTQGTTLDNISCLNAALNPRNFYVHNNEFFNVYDPESPGAENITLIVFFQGANNRIEYNRLYYTNSPAYSGPVKGRCFKYKHPGTDGNVFIKGNQFWNCAGAAVENASTGMRMSNNLMVNSPDSQDAVGYSCSDLGAGTAYCRDAIIENNTFVNYRPYQIQASGINDHLGTTTFRNNVAYDNAPGFNSENGFFRIARYGSDAEYNLFRTQVGLVSDNNCFYDPNTALQFDYFADSPMTTGVMANFSGWQTLGYDANSAVVDPGFDSYYRATNPACSGKGWLSSASGGVARPAAPTGVQAVVIP